MASSLSRMFQEEDASVLRFNEQELNEILGMIESRGVGTGPFPGGPMDDKAMPQLDLDGLAFMHLDNASMHLQFQPRSPGSEIDPTSVSSVENNCCSALESYLPMSAAEQQAQVAQIMMSQGQGGPTSSTSRKTQVATDFPANSFMAPVFPAFSGSAQDLAMQQAILTQQQRQRQQEKPQISHSSVEKQRRDRINSLIDELRDLVPPQKGGVPVPSSSGNKFDAASAEARRPKHVVLADTIALLKQWRAMGGGQSVPTAVKQEMEQNRDMDPKLDTVAEKAPAMPHIPMSLNSFAGVTVEKAAEPGMMFVQVKCRDRRGLLSDIINALKLLPLEIRTAAVVTSGDGMVRDVFEIRVDDPDLKTETIQNMVHDALYHTYLVKTDEGCGKKHRTRD